MKNIEALKKEIQYLKEEIEHLKADKKSLGFDNQQQTAYQQTQVRFRTVFENSRLGNKIITSDLKILQVNRALVAMLGYDRKEDIIGTFIMDYVPEGYQEHWKLLQSKLWHTKMPSFSLETCLRRKDGSTFWCQVTSILFMDQDDTLGYTIIEDISAQHKLKEDRENFISIASHELKTPLTSLQAYLQIMKGIIENETVISDKLIKISLSANQSITKLGALVNDLLDSTKISKGQLNLNVSHFTIFKLVENCCTHIRSEGKYTLTYKGDADLTISADEQKLEQVLVNLVNNAVKYAPESKEIVVAVEELADEVRIAVIDQGNGISKDKLPLLFESYYQVKESSINMHGLGLGLYISAEIIRKHGGEIGVESQIGKGSTFWFTIPKK
jgi:PAS domain S-box-containing protein